MLLTASTATSKILKLTEKNEAVFHTIIVFLQNSI